MEEALSAAPAHLRALGLAFRLLLLAAPGSMVTGSAPAQLVAPLAPHFRSFMDPALVRTGGEGGGGRGARALEMRVSGFRVFRVSGFRVSGFRVTGVTLRRLHGPCTDVYAQGGENLRVGGGG